MVSESSLTSVNIHRKGRSTGRGLVPRRAEDLFCIGKIVPFGRDEYRAERDGDAHIVRAGNRIQDRDQLQLCTRVFAGGSAVVLGTVEMGVYDGRSTHDVRVQAQGNIRVIDAEQSYQKPCHASSYILAPIHHFRCRTLSAAAKVMLFPESAKHFPHFSPLSSAFPRANKGKTKEKQRKYLLYFSYIPPIYLLYICYYK